MAKKTKSTPAATEENSFKTEREEALEAEKRSLEDDMDDDEDLKTSSSSSSNAEAAASLASAATANEAAPAVKNFRHHPDIESFYRFIYENDLRLEGLQIINQFLDQKRLKKGVKFAKTQAH